jgi:hypothetical protein
MPALSYQARVVLRLLSLCVLFSDGSLGLRPVWSAVESVTTSAELPAGKLLVKLTFEGDYQAVERFVGEYNMQIVRHDPPILYVLVDKDRMAELRQAGHVAIVLEPSEFFTRMIRIDNPNDALLAQVRGIGARLIQREPTYAVVSATLAQLETMRRQGIQFQPATEQNLVPRFVRITVPDEGSVQLVVAAGTDIFEIIDKVVLGRAFDHQIETLRQQGLKVEVVAPPSPGQQ